MTFNDPIAELLTKIRNAKNALHRFVYVRFSKEKLSIIEILKERKFIESFLIDEDKKEIKIYLKYSKDRESSIRDLKRISKPGGRKYVKNKDIPKVFGGKGIAIISTSKGILDDKKAAELKLGGELLCYVW